MSTELVPVTSWSRSRRHLAHADALRPDPDGGRFGKALCDGQTHSDVYDQDWVDAKRLAWFGKPAGSQLITDMRLCKRCEKAAARLAATP